MKWMLVVILANVSPVKTGLLFDTLDACLRAEDTMRAEYAKAYNTWMTWAKQNPAASNYPSSEPFMRKRIIPGSGVCIPHG